MRQISAWNPPIITRFRPAPCAACRRAWSSNAFTDDQLIGTTNGDSHRLARAPAGKAVIALT
jgi:hypothetical protein